MEYWDNYSKEVAEKWDANWEKSGQKWDEFLQRVRDGFDKNGALSSNFSLCAYVCFGGEASGNMSIGLGPKVGVTYSTGVSSVAPEQSSVGFTCSSGWVYFGGNVSQDALFSLSYGLSEGAGIGCAGVITISTSH